MPLSIKRRKEIEASKMPWQDKYLYGIKHVCPQCKAIHHWRPLDGCKNPRCDFRGELERLTRENGPKR